MRVLVTPCDRLKLLEPVLRSCPDLRHVVVVDAGGLPGSHGIVFHRWHQLLRAPASAGHRVIDTDVVGILYTSGSTGNPKGVVLSHRNMVCGTKSVASYIQNHSDDTLLAALQLSLQGNSEKPITSSSR